MNIKKTGAEKNCPWGMWPGRTLAVAWTLMFVCLVFDRDAEKLLNALSWITLAFAATTDSQGPRLRRVWPVVAAWLLVIMAAGLAAWFAGSFPGAVHAFVKYQIAVVWFAVLWLAAPIFLPSLRRNHNAPEAGPSAMRWVSSLVIVLLLFVFHSTLSAAASLFPKESMELLGAEILPYSGMFIIIARSACCAPNSWWRLGTRSMWVLLIATCLGMAAVATLVLAMPELTAGLVHQGYFRIDSNAPDTPRLQFLFHHHNRAGFFAACAIFLCLAGAWGGRYWRIAGMGGAAAATFALPFTLTRGALLAAGAGMVLFAVGGLSQYRRGRMTLAAGAIVAMPLLWFMLPDSYQGHIAKITNPANYHANAEGSIGARLIIWRTALSMIQSRPALGFGYGFENFESAAQLDNPEIPSYFHDAVHAHNLWLETAAETGVPGFALLLLFTILRIGGLARAWWRGMRSGYAMAWLLLLWLCLECVIQIYGFANYPLRRNLGFLTYWIWGGSIVLVLLAAKDERAAELAREDTSLLD